MLPAVVAAGEMSNKRIRVYVQVLILSRKGIAQAVWISLAAWSPVVESPKLTRVVTSVGHVKIDVFHSVIDNIERLLHAIGNCVKAIVVAHGCWGEEPEGIRSNAMRVNHREGITT